MDTIQFSEWLVGLMREKELSQAELARAAGVSRQTISNYIAGKIAKPDEDALKAIAVGLGISKNIILQKAGIVESSRDQEDIIENILYQMEGITLLDKEEVLEFVQMKKRIAEKRAKYR